MAAATHPPWVDMLGGVVWESKRIVAAHSRHFLALSVLFLLPLSLLLVAAAPASLFLQPGPFGRDPLLPPPETRLRLRLPDLAGGGGGGEAVALSLACSCAAALLSLCAAAAVTHSVRDGFLARPVRLVTALRSLPSSLWRLLFTSLAALLVLAAYAAILASLFILFLRFLHVLGLPHQHLSPAAFATATAALVLGAVYMQVNWALAGVVAVAESSWGIQPLRRSAHLVRGMRWGVLCLVLFFSAGIGLMLWCADLGSAAEVKDWHGVAPLVVRVVCASAATVLLLLYSLVSTTVMYIYCKALHGELAGEIAEEFAREYVCLPFDAHKIPHVVSVVSQ